MPGRATTRRTEGRRSAASLPGVFALLALIIAGCGEDEPAGPADEGATAHLVLGDSLGVGVGADVPEEGGYAPLLHDEAADLAHYRSLAVAGETTESMIDDGQLQRAVDAVERGVDDAPVRLVTLTIGGNDGALLYEPCAGGVTEACIAAARSLLDRFDDHYGAILGDLATAAGEDTQVVVMTYYNPLLHPGCEFHQQAEIAEAMLEGSDFPGLEHGLNDRIRALAADHGALVAETHGALDADALTDDCLHPNDDGYRVLADRFAEAAAE